MRYRILVVEEQPIVRLGIERALERDGRFDVAGWCETAAEAVACWKERGAALILVDPAQVLEAGLEQIARLRKGSDAPQLLVFSALDEVTYGSRALRAGAAGVLSKASSPEELCSALIRVLQGEQVVGQRLGAYLGRSRGKEDQVQRDAGALLTDREVEVLRLLALGIRKSEIARAMGLSPKTVETHRGNIKGKYGLQTPGELMKLALQLFGDARAPLANVE
jgi:DNA-binding NarL/FixJ family response regulator